MAKYIGKRIVPTHCGVWDQMKSYEMLSIVLEQATGDSYISRRVVPSGTALTDETFWSLHSKYSQQIKDMSDQLAAAEQRIVADNDSTEAAIRADNQATREHVDESEASLTQRVDNAETAMTQQKTSFDQTAQQLNTRMDAVLAAGTGAGDTEILDARVDVDGGTHATLGDALRSSETKSINRDAAIRNTISLSEQYNNLWAVGNISYGKAVHATGGHLITDADYDATDFIPVQGLKVLFGKGARYWFYDEEKLIIAGATGLLYKKTELYPNSEICVVTVPEGACYFRICARTETEKVLYTAGVYESYLLDYLEQAENFYGRNLWDCAGTTEKTRISDAGEAVTDNSCKTTAYIPVNKGDLVYGYGARFACYDANYTVVHVAIFSSLSTKLTGTDMNYYVVPEGVRYFRICGKTSDETQPFEIFIVPFFSSYLMDIVNQMKPQERKLYCIGDSITRGMYTIIGDTSSRGPTAYGYPYWIGKINNYTVVNLGESGGGYANKGTQTNSNGKDIVDNNSFSDADIITIAFGVNDWKGESQNVVLGDMTSVSGDGTVIGNMKYMIETLYAKKPDANIIVMLPMNQNRFYPDAMTLENNWSFGYATEREGKTLSDYRAAIKACADYYNVKVVDTEEVAPITRLNIRTVLGDGLHPTVAFYKQMGQALAQYIH